MPANRRRVSKRFRTVQGPSLQSETNTRDPWEVEQHAPSPGHLSASRLAPKDRRHAGRQLPCRYRSENGQGPAIRGCVQRRQRTTSPESDPFSLAGIQPVAGASTGSRRKHGLQECHRFGAGSDSVALSPTALGPTTCGEQNARRRRMTSIASGFSSTKTADRPARAAASPVVPLPAKKSSTFAPTYLRI